MKKLVAILAVFLSVAVHADVILPKVIDSSMILQRDAKVPIWGWADQGEEVTVTFAGQTKKANPDKSGRWEVNLDPLKASAEGREMIIQGKNKLTLNDILVGEVWLASGQSNMEWSFARVDKASQEYAAQQKGNDLIRVFHVNQHLTSGVPMGDTSGAWRKVAKENNFHVNWNVSSVGFFFAVELHKKLGVPVAFLDANWGGQRIERFVAPEGYEAVGLKYEKGNINAKNYAAQLRQKAEALKKAAELADKGIMSPVGDANVHTGKATGDIYNAMVAPLTPYAIKGAIWYQGESNRGAGDYFEKVKALSAGWSKVFRVKDIPLYQVQIAPFLYNRGNKKDSTLSNTIWTAQYRSSKEVPGVGLVCIHDTNINIHDIHPQNKKPVGERLAALALKNEYGKPVVTAGPEFAKASLSGNKIIVSFSGIDQGLSTKDGKAPSWFEVSADGKTFVDAKAEIKDNTVVVSADGLANPKFVRMGWYDIAIPNLQDKNGWPVFPFPAMEAK